MNRSRNTEQKNEWLPMAALTIGSICYGFNNVFTKVALSITNPWTLLSMRFLLAWILLSLPVLMGREHLRFHGKRLRPLLIFALIEPVYFFFESFAISLTNATYTGVVLALSPITSTLFAALFLREYPSRREMIFCLFPIAGVLLMTLSGAGLGIVTPIGVVCLIGALLSTTGIRVSNRDAALSFTAYERTYAMVISCSIYFTVRALLREHGNLAAFMQPLKDVHFTGSLFGLVLLCSISSNILCNYAAGRMTVVRYTALSSVSTLFSLFSGVIFLGEPMTLVSFTGAMLIMIGLWGMSHSRARRHEAAGHRHLPHLPELHRHPHHKTA